MRSGEWQEYSLPNGMNVDDMPEFRDLPADVQQILRLRAASGNEKGVILDDAIHTRYSVSESLEALSELNNATCTNNRGLVIGAMSLDIRPDMVWLDSLAVDPRLRSQGIGAQAIRFADQLAEEYGLPIIAGNSQPNPDTLRFYRNNGFECYETRGPYFHIIKEVYTAR